MLSFEESGTHGGAIRTDSGRLPVVRVNAATAVGEALGNAVHVFLVIRPIEQRPRDQRRPKL